LAAGQRPGVISLDLDGFKPINDRLGHPAGDCVLTEIGRRLADLAAEHSVFAARPGGDEFVLILPESAALSSVAVRAALAAPIALAAGTVRVSASLGLARPEGPHDTVDAVLARADRALYDAKEAAKNGAIEAARQTSVSGDG
jgi:diguanylate cyclase (GGDEF)-like protein